MNPFTPWTPYAGTWTAFSAAGLAKAGTQVDCRGLDAGYHGRDTYDKILLIGDINEVGGVCEDCTDMVGESRAGGETRPPTMVTRYRRLVDESDYIEHVATIRITETV